MKRIYASVIQRPMRILENKEVSKYMKKENLLEYLRRKSGIPFLSDLRDTYYFSHIKLEVTRIHPDDFDLDDWSKTIHYITGKNEELTDTEQARSLYRKIVIFIDEAHLLDQKDFYWLMDLYNVLSRRDILLTTFLFGSHELKELKTLFLSTGKEQIIGRFMMNEYEFYGLCSKEELKMCLISFDNPVRLPSSESPVRLMDVFFPEASMDGKSFANDLSDIYWDMFEDIRSRFNIHNKDIPMKYFIDSFCICLAIFGKDGYRKCYFPTAKDITDCIIESGYPNTV